MPSRRIADYGVGELIVPVPDPASLPLGGDTIGSFVGVVLIVPERECLPFFDLPVVVVVDGEAVGMSDVVVCGVGDVGIGIDVLGDIVWGDALVLGSIDVDGVVVCGVVGVVLTPGLVCASAAAGSVIAAAMIRYFIMFSPASGRD